MRELPGWEAWPIGAPQVSSKGRLARQSGGREMSDPRPKSCAIESGVRSDTSRFVASETPATRAFDRLQNR